MCYVYNQWYDISCATLYLNYDYTHVRWNNIYVYILWGTRGEAVGRSSELQAVSSRVRFPMVSLEYFIDKILPAAL